MSFKGGGGVTLSAKGGGSLINKGGGGSTLLFIQGKFLHRTLERKKREDKRVFVFFDACLGF